MYGARDAAQNWQEEFSSMLESIGFKAGRSSPCIFYHENKDIRTFVHGDDYVSAGSSEDLDWLRKRLEEKYAIKTEVLGDGKGETREIRVLNRIIRWETDGISYEPDPRHAEIIAKEMGVDGTKGVVSPSIKESIDDEETPAKGTPDGGSPYEGVELQGAEATKYRAIIARGNFLSIDRPDIQYAVKEASRCMAKPTTKDWAKLERLAKYLVHRPRAVTKYPWQDRPKEIITYTDSDWAGCRKTRKSTSGGALTYNGCIIKTWSRTQNNMALSSAEAELYAEVKAASETLGLVSMWRSVCVSRWRLGGRLESPFPNGRLGLFLYLLGNAV